MHHFPANATPNMTLILLPPPISWSYSGIFIPRPSDDHNAGGINANDHNNRQSPYFSGAHGINTTQQSPISLRLSSQCHYPSHNILSWPVLDCNHLAAFMPPNHHTPYIHCFPPDPGFRTLVINSLHLPQPSKHRFPWVHKFL